MQEKRLFGVPADTPLVLDIRSKISRWVNMNATTKEDILITIAAMVITGVTTFVTIRAVRSIRENVK